MRKRSNTESVKSRDVTEVDLIFNYKWNVFVYRISVILYLLENPDINSYIIKYSNQPVSG